MGLGKMFRAVGPTGHGGFGPMGSGMRLPTLSNLEQSIGIGPQGVYGYSGFELYETVMSIPAFWRGANFLSGLLARVPWDAYTTHGRDQETLIDPRPSFLEQPAPPDTRLTTFKSLFLDYLINGNGIGIVATWDGQGKPTSMWPVPAAFVAIRRVNTDQPSLIGVPPGQIEYRIAGKPYSPDEIVHFKGPCAPGAPRGFGILEAHCRGALLTARQLQRDARNASRHGVPPGYLRVTSESEEANDPDAMADVQRDWMRKRDEGGVAILNNAVEFTPVAWNPDEAQLIQARQMSDNEIANLLGLPATWVNSANNGGTSLTYSNVDSEALSLIKFPMGEHFEQWGQTLTLKYPRNTCVRADLDNFLQGDTQARYNSYASAIQTGWMLRSEARKKERFPVIKGIDAEPLPRKAELALEKTDPLAATVAQVPPPGAPVPATAARLPLPALPAGSGTYSGQRGVSELELDPQGRHLWAYWTHGAGLARWTPSPHPYDKLRLELAEEDVPEHEIDGLAANIFQAVFHKTPTEHAHG